MAYMTKITTDNGVKPIGSNLFGTCSSSASAQTKVVSMSDFNVLIDGVTIHVLFDHKNSASGADLQVGSTSSKPIRYNGNNNGSWDDNALVSFTYYNNYWYQNDYQSGDGDTTYTMTISGHTITLTPSVGTAQSVTVPDNNTTYDLSISGHDVTLTGSDGSADTVTVPDNNTTYSLSKTGSTIKLSGSDGSSSTVTDANATYGLSINGHTITIVANGGSSSVTVPDNDRHYGLHTKTYEIGTINVNAGASLAVTNIAPMTYTNGGNTYYPMGIMGISLSGTGSSWTVVTQFQLTNRGQNTTDFSARVRNFGTSNYSVTLSVEVLWWGIET